MLSYFLLQVWSWLPEALGRDGGIHQQLQKEVRVREAAEEFTCMLALHEDVQAG